MTTLLEIDARAPASHDERAAVASVVEIDVADRETADRMARSLVVAADAFKEKGPLRIDTVYSGTGRLRIALTGSLPAMNILNRKDESDRRLFEERTPISSTVQIENIQQPFADSIAAYLVASGKNHPQDDLPLRIETNYDVAASRLQITLGGSVFAVSYVCVVVNARLTQRLKRETPWSKE